SLSAYVFLPMSADCEAPGVVNFPAYPISCSAFTVTPITVGQTVSGMLAVSDCTSPINGISYHADRYSFDGVEGEAITMEATSTDINGALYVYLLHADGAQVASSGVGYGPPAVVSIPSGGGSFTLPTTDTYLIEVSSYVTGSYLLTLGGPSTPYTMAGAVTSGGPLAGVTITFSLVAGPGAVPTAVRSDAAGTWSQTGVLLGSGYRAAQSLSAYVF